jgi:hypothetical protein
MNSPMADANLAIINKVKDFIQEVAVNSSVREQYCYLKTAFTRNRVLTLPRIAVLLISALKQSLSIEIRRFFEQFSEEITCSKQAFCEQRVKLKPVFFQDMNQIPVSGFYRCYGEKAKRWKGMYLWAVDGSTIALPETEELRKVYGGAGKQQAHVVVYFG